MRVIGIDPGSLRCGYGIVDVKDRFTTHVASGTIRLHAGQKLPQRLLDLYTALREVLRIYKPSEASVERVFFARNPKTALSLGYARGVVLLCLAEAGIPVTEYTAGEIKRAVTGYGRADKFQVQRMVQRLLGLEDTPQPDRADALALALCHANSTSWPNG